ncbi:hypothetical protein Dtox_1772 [Desulfofarcimen acetoxidans DSM 771]|uniref:Uncharacterized protein n=1 Tax=Desulfofarcimen acetoxidans (strain ATCC 49208 / DSM 771 / KCTC 5769 / VKM B-1644 / 5575) TaxID=485916 RepID=C8VX50_DESAS|nr:hypothetical protein [Desulfofarcimen acetoxidans]ACV62626.1 hypothetical protein Dtox_1772 [Desulfofarcimen acetoxidans DSM 771]
MTYKADFQKNSAVMTTPIGDYLVLKMISVYESGFSLTENFSLTEETGKEKNI